MTRCGVDSVKTRRPLRIARHSAFLVYAVALAGCVGVPPADVSSLLAPQFHRSEIVGFLAGLGTTFAAVPDVVWMCKHRSSVGMNPRMAAITGAFQILWVYYGLLIRSRPVIAWNMIGVLINLLSVAAFVHFARNERRRRERSATGALSGRVPD